MKKLIALCLLTSCYPLRNARFVDKSENDPGPWICLKDTDSSNVMGIQCASVAHLKQIPDAPQSREPTTDL